MPAPTAVGSARDSRGGDTTFAATFGSSARPTAGNATGSRRGRRTTAAARSSRIGSPTPCSTLGRRRRRSPARGRRWPICRPPAAKSFWRRSCWRRAAIAPRVRVAIQRRHVEVAVFVVKNNPKTRGLSRPFFQGMDCRVKPGNDDGWVSANAVGISKAEPRCPLVRQRARPHFAPTQSALHTAAMAESTKTKPSADGLAILRELEKQLLCLPSPPPHHPHHPPHNAHSAKDAAQPRPPTPLPT